jgi:hypothetical protein
VSRFRSTSFTAAVLLVLAPMLVAGAQSTVTVSPFVSYVPSAAVNPLAGFSLTFGGTTGLALRSGAELSISNPDSVARLTGSTRPWGADADIMLFLGGLGGGATVFSRALSPYVFSGIGLMGEDSAGTNVVRHGWSYGLGAAIPLGLDADLFAEARWRMPEYVLPTADGAPDSKSAMRFGLSFHVGGASPPRRTPRRRYAEYDDEDEPVYVAAPAPAPQPVVVQQPAPQVVVVQSAPPPPQQVVVVQQPAPEPQPRYSISVPIILGGGRVVHRRETTRVVVVGSECSRRRGCSTSRRYEMPITTTPQQTTSRVVRVQPVQVQQKAEPEDGKARRPSRRP